MHKKEIICETPEQTFAVGEQLAGSIKSGDIVLLYGGLGTGKTLFTKGILNALEFDIDEVTSPSFALVNLYKTKHFDVFHIDLWRLEGHADPAEAIGLDEILENENAVTIIEWADRLRNSSVLPDPISVQIEGNGGEPREIVIQSAAVPRTV